MTRRRRAGRRRSGGSSDAGSRSAKSGPAPVGPAPAVADAALVSVEGLSVSFTSPAGEVRVVEDVSFEIRAGEAVGMVGESGCGKTVTAMSILGLLPGTGRIEAGRIVFDGRDLVALRRRELRQVRGKEIGLISQEPMVSLNPAFQRRLAAGRGPPSSTTALPHDSARARQSSCCGGCTCADPEEVARRYPHELSGGMAQRVSIARRAGGRPEAPDRRRADDGARRDRAGGDPRAAAGAAARAGMAILLVTHDWGVVADICERAVVMYAGQVVERADLVPIFRRAAAPVHRGAAGRESTHAPAGGAAALDSGRRTAPRRLAVRLSLPPALPARNSRVPRPGDPARAASASAGDTLHTSRAAGHRSMSNSSGASPISASPISASPISAAPLLTVRDLSVEFNQGRRRPLLRAVDGISLTVTAHETVGLVGESGSGKTTIGRAILGLTPINDGTFSFDGVDITHASHRHRQRLSADLQVVFQDPYSSLNPTRTIGQTLSEPLRVHGKLDRAATSERVRSMLERVGLPRTPPSAIQPISLADSGSGSRLPAL